MVAGEAFTSAERHDLIVQPFKIVRHVELLGTRCDDLQLGRDVADRRYWRCQYFIFDAETRCYASARCHDNNHVVRGRTGRNAGRQTVFLRGRQRLARDLKLLRPWEVYSPWRRSMFQAPARYTAYRVAIPISASRTSGRIGRKHGWCSLYPIVNGPNSRPVLHLLCRTRSF